MHGYKEYFEVKDDYKKVMNWDMVEDNKSIFDGLPSLSLFPSKGDPDVSRNFYPIYYNTTY
ncbi:hypothetical protein PQX77_002928 [Marasmius sp. AFHP31]|nr:hypothetical protein PQX77_002928 [Marasmius sp. AFHP31]